MKIINSSLSKTLTLKFRRNTARVRNCVPIEHRAHTRVMLSDKRAERSETGSDVGDTRKLHQS